MRGHSGMFDWHECSFDLLYRYTLIKVPNSGNLNEEIINNLWHKDGQNETIQDFTPLVANHSTKLHTNNIHRPNLIICNEDFCNH